MGCACGKDTCGCGEAPKMVFLQDEEGVAHPFYLSERLEVASRTYAFLVSTEETEQYALLRIEQDEHGNEYMQNIRDEDEWNQIQQTLFDPVQ
jgi:uncharacterized protein YrzB (UPF0473 family)